MKVSKMFVGAALALALLGCRAQTEATANPPAAQAPAAEAIPPAELDGPQTGLETVPLTIKAAGKTHRLTVEVARTADQQATGMMFRESIADDRGMLFPFERPKPASFWMRNTLIPLDLVFVRLDGTVARVAANAVPLSLAAIESGEPVIAVLEIGGGRAAALGIDETARVSWPGGPRG